MHNTSRLFCVCMTGLALLLLTACQSVSPQRGNGKTHNDHYVPVVSTAPSLEGQTALLYLRERLSPGRSAEGPVVLFVHGAGTPAEVAFDAGYPGFSWMEYLAASGLRVYSMDLTGYGRSVRPPVMNDRCNFSAEQQLELFGDSCRPGSNTAATTMASDWHDIDAAVEFLRARENVDRVSLVGWSQGGPRTLGYTALHPEKVSSIVVLAPAYRRDLPASVDGAGLAGAVMTKQSRTDFIANWDRQTACTGQYDPAVADAVWQDMLASDPVGASWGSGVRRAPRVPTFGWTPREVAATSAPVMAVIGLLDEQVQPERVRELYDDLGSERKVLLEMPCASHNAMWEKDAGSLYEASRQWLLENSYRGQTSGVFRLEE